ncbi:hypothetical protein AB0L40_07875 [Patulibacter sp. NPDC049589]|uniref:hypothetical protein n=1 Tax=Patulibacter sp. NPDC049589 TaxID=3154731 RepID=UPI003415125B
MSARSDERRRLPVVIGALVLVLVALAAVILTRGGDGDGVARQAATCDRLGGKITGSSDARGYCDVPRAPGTVETVVLRGDGGLDVGDLRRRRAACAADPDRVRRTALVRARTRTVDSYVALSWRAPGVCRGRETRVTGAERVRFRQARLLDRARVALTAGRADDALADARAADDLASTTATRASVSRARRAVRRTSGPGSGSSGTQLVSPAEYLGLSCAEIGHAFRVAPGADPPHDPDGDGQACVGQ